LKENLEAQEDEGKVTWGDNVGQQKTKTGGGGKNKCDSLQKLKRVETHKEGGPKKKENGPQAV